MSSISVPKKRKVVSDGLFYAELNHLFQTELGEDGYAGKSNNNATTIFELSIKC